MKALKYILFLLIILFIGASIYVAVQPNSFEVTRTKTINAPASVVYENVIDFKNWEAWSSWVEAKPETKITLAEQTRGIDGSYSWEDEDGVGRMKTVDTKLNEIIVQEMQFGEFPKSDVKWQLNPIEKGKTEVTWTISGKDLPFQVKAFSAFMGGMEKQIAPHFERGLEKLDSVLVADMKAYNITIEGITQHSGGFYLYNTTSCKMEDLQSKMQEMMPKIGGYALANNITMAGKPFVIYHKWDTDNNTVMFSYCIPTTSRILTNDPEVLTGQLDPFKAVKVVLKGGYENLEETWEKAMAYIQAEELVQPTTGIALESYAVDENTSPNPAHWITEIYLEVE
ncbi:SRPBCC family protein [Psychroserpens sp. SPM9]|uniref:SRPBCC family protein n=1 Tax=Psychroserpens sp. SPM9 TaxID=2975598 RepID=UPI0021A3102F|nr:SRPBCC family protein [Psychroserpens sp. SPM9]MDG5492554.1 SRPBCC family protein [Psychroserpens sp. SPM9]